jgi:hypothetical protein
MRLILETASLLYCSWNLTIPDLVGSSMDPLSVCASGLYAIVSTPYILHVPYEHHRLDAESERHTLERINHEYRRTRLLSQKTRIRLLHRRAMDCVTRTAWPLISWWKWSGRQGPGRRGSVPVAEHNNEVRDAHRIRSRTWRLQSYTLRLAHVLAKTNKDSNVLDNQLATESFPQLHRPLLVTRIDSISSPSWPNVHRWQPSRFLRWW